MEDYDFKLTNQPAELEEVQHQLQSVLQASAIRLSVISAINVALGEWLENITQYAFADGASHGISITCRIGPAEITLQVTDDGRPFNPCEYPALDDVTPARSVVQTGRGIHLIRHLMDRVEYQRRGPNNVLLLTKLLH